MIDDQKYCSAPCLKALVLRTSTVTHHPPLAQAPTPREGWHFLTSTHLLGWPPFCPQGLFFCTGLTFFSLCWLGEVEANIWMKRPRASGRSPHHYSLSSYNHSGIRGFCQRSLQSLDYLDFSLHSSNLFCLF